MADYKQIAAQAARKYGLPEQLFLRQIQQESGFNPNARSPAGASGIAQIMPGTAKAWGVNPSDPVASLNAAARNMASYVRQFGSYEKALRAYNAGPGAVEKSRGFGETNNYVKKIMGGANVSSQGGGSPAPVGGTPNPNKNALLAQYLLSGRQDVSLLAQALQSDSAGGSVSPSKSLGGDKVGKPLTGLRELFYDPLGGVDEGKEVGAIGGHSDHVHVAAKTPGDRVRLQKLAERMGLTVTSTTGGKHTAGSFHYQGTGVDVAGSPAQMAAYYRRVKSLYGA